MKHFSILVALATSTFVSAAFAASCAPINNVLLTFYGWPDNDPPSPDNAFDCGRGKGPDGSPIAGGTGSYSDPISFATAPDNPSFKRCAIVYVPSLRKYFRNEDVCGQCKKDWDGSKKYHIDIWTGSNKVNGGNALISCENNLSPGSKPIINNAPSGLPVDTTPLYNGKTCYKTTYPVGSVSGLCAGGSSSADKSSSGDKGLLASDSIGNGSFVSPPTNGSSVSPPTRLLRRLATKP